MMSELLRIAVVCEGVLLLLIDFLAFVYRKLTEGISLGWGFIGGVMILLGAVPGLSDWSKIIPVEVVPALVFLDAAIIAGVFYLSVKISVLLRKNQELAMHVSLLNQENEQILEKLGERRGVADGEETKNEG